MTHKSANRGYDLPNKGEVDSGGVDAYELSDTLFEQIDADVEAVENLIADPSEGGRKLKNVATSVWEYPVDDTEYYAPDESKGKGKRVYRWHFYKASYGASWQTITSSITGATQLRIVDTFIELRSVASDHQSLVLLTASDLQAIRVPTAGPTTTFEYNIATVGDQLSGYVDYIKDADV